MTYLLGLVDNASTSWLMDNGHSGNANLKGKINKIEASHIDLLCCLSILSIESVVGSGWWLSVMPRLRDEYTKRKSV